MIKIDLDNDKQVDYFKNEALENKIEEKDQEIERLNNILDTLMQDMAILNGCGKREIKPKYVFDRIVMLREGVDKDAYITKN